MSYAIPATVHAALVTFFAWLVQLLFTAIGVDLGGEIATQLATVIVAYILSLAGLSLFSRAVYGQGALVDRTGYKPPFT